MGEVKLFIALSLMFFRSAYTDEGCCESLQKITILEANGCNSTESSEEVQCADIECSLKNEGLMEGDEIIEDKVKIYLDGIVNEYPKENLIIDRLKAMCLDGKYAKYPPKDDDCMALKFTLCLYLNIMMECDSWKDTKLCKEASDHAKKCKEEAKTPLKIGFV